MDLKQVQNLIKNFEKSNLTSLDIELEGLKLKLSKNGPEVITKEVISNKEITTEVKEKCVEESKTLNEVKSPLVGTYYESNSPTSGPFVEVGQTVVVGQTLCIIEAMKIMNEITSPVNGVVEEIKVKNATAVGYDQVLMVIK